MITGGRSLVSSPPTFSADGKHLLVCTGNTVSVFSTSTGMQVTELEGHTDKVTSVIVVPPPQQCSTSANKFLCYCWTSSLDGTIRNWDFSVPESLKMIKIGLSIFSMVIPNVLAVRLENKGKASDVSAFISVKNISKPDNDNKALRGQIRRCNLTQSSLNAAILTETRHPEVISISASGELFGIRNKRKVHVWRILARDSKYDVKMIKLHHTKKLSALAFHPKENIVAGGDETGRILIWRGVGNRSFSKTEVSVKGRKSKGRKLKNEEEMPGVVGDNDAESCSTWHWHPSEVKILSFSSDGAHLYSGGKEGVLVVWQLETGKKKFLPRIGSPLLYFTDSLDPTLFAVSRADNQIHLLKMPSMENLKSISGIKLPCSFPEIYEGLRSGFAFDHTAGLVAIPTESYGIQFYSLFDDHEVSQVQVCERSHQPNDNITLVVTSLALSADGSKLSTADVQLPEDGIGALVCLKFWDAGSSRGQFTLSTIIYEPHSDAGVSALAFHPTCNMAVSSSLGGDFKIWVHSNKIRQNDQMCSKSGWRCHSVGSYKKKPMTAIAFSADGSVLAVAAETVVTLWDPNQNVLVAVIGETLERIETLYFVGNSEYIVSASRGSKPQLSVWSTSKLSIFWSYALFVEAVACSVDSSCFAVLATIPKSCEGEATNGVPGQSRDGAILLFNVEDPIPVGTWSVKKAKGGGISFIQADPSLLNERVSNESPLPEMLAYISGDHEYIVFDPYCKNDMKIVHNHRRSVVPFKETEKIGYVSIYGDLPQIRMESNETPVPFVPSGKPWETIFSGSSHVLPPLTDLCSVFLESLLEKVPSIQD